MSRVSVVAGILVNPHGQILITERIAAGPLCGLWEFPGGKIAAGESEEAALARELAEELGIAAKTTEPFMQIEHDYPDRSVSLRFFRVLDWTGEPAGIEGQKLRWIEPAEIEEELMLPADAPVIAALLRQRPG